MRDNDNRLGKNVTRRRVIGATAAGLATTALAGCGGNGNNNDNNGGGTQTMNGKKLEIMHGWTGGDGADAAKNLKKGFKDKNPDVPLDFRAIGGTGNVNLDSAVARRLKNDNPPGAFAGWPGENLKKYEGVLRNITHVWEDAGYTDSMNETAKELCKFNGEFRATPLGSHRLNNLFYNTSVVEKAGVDPTSIDSPSALVDAMKTVEDKTNAVGMAQAMKAPWTNLQIFSQVMLGQSGYQAYMDWIKGNGDKANVKDALQTEKEMLQHINSDASSISFTEAASKVINGKAAFQHQGNWLYGVFRSNDNFNYGEEWDWVAFPGTEDMYTLHIDSFIAPNNNPTPVKNDIWQTYVGTERAQIGYNNLKGSVPLRMDVDGSQLSDFLQMNYKHLKNKPKQPPTLAHGLAVSPEKLGNCKSAIGNNFMGPFNVDATASALMKAVK